MFRRIKLLIVTAIGIVGIVLPLTLQAKTSPVKNDGTINWRGDCVCGGSDCGMCLQQ